MMLDGREAHPRVTDLLALPDGRLLAATTQGLIRSSDEGVTWTQPEAGSGHPVFCVAASHDDSELVVAATESGFLRSRDGGATWDQVSSNLPGVTPHALVIMPSDDRVLLATTTAGLFRSSNQGVTWRRVNGGIPRSDLTGIAVSPDGHTIYASDFDWGGIFRSTDGGVKWERMSTGDLPSDRVWALGLDPEAPERVLATSASGLHLLVPPIITKSIALTP